MIVIAKHLENGTISVSMERGSIEKISEDSKRQAGSGGDRTLVIAKGSIWRGRIAINIICYQHKI